MAINVQKAIGKWQANTGAAAEAMKDGVRNTSKDPIALAAAAADKYIQNVQKAHSEGRFQKGLAKTNKAEWQAAMIDKGAQNMANGARAASPRALKAIGDVIQYTQSVADQIASMPSATEADMDARALKTIQLMREYKKSR